MKKEEIMKMFIDHNTKKANTKIKRNYDVKITLNKSGRADGGFVVRFGFINKAGEVFKKGMFVEATDIEKMRDKIYFKSSEEKEHAKMYKLSSDAPTCSYFSFTPTAEAEKVYRTLWLNKEFKLKYDEECEMYYIELGENEE